MLTILSLFFCGMGVCADEYDDAVVNDWRRQEIEADRDIGSVESLRALSKCAREFRDWYEGQDWATDEHLATLDENIAAAVPDHTMGTDVIEQMYVDLRMAMRGAALSNPEIGDQPLVFLKNERFTCQMLHEHLSYYYEAANMNGGGVFLLKHPGKSFETEDLTKSHFPKGVFQTLSLSWDGASVYFAFSDLSKLHDSDAPKLFSCDLSARPYLEKFESEYMQKPEGKFHLYKMNLADGRVTQLTDGPNDDFDPIELPDGSVVFMSTRRGGYGRCHGHWEPLRVHTLHRLDPDGTITCLSWHETNEWCPTVMHDGRILYTRWDYVDRSASRHHGLWTTNPDGTASAILFGNYTYDVNACYQPKPIPDSKKIMFVGGAHHLNMGGTLVILDPSRVRYDPITAEDDLSSIEIVTPEIKLPETEENIKRVCKQYYHSPWPLSEEVWLTAYSHEPLGGMLANNHSCGKTGLYYRDCFGNLELLYSDDSEFSSLFPIPVAARKKPPVVPTALPNHADDFGTFMLSNVYESLMPFPKDRPITELRIFQLLPKGPDYRGNVPPVGYPFAANARLLLGTVPVEKDGSAYFKVPARIPVYFQAVDKSGRAVQSMRSIVYLQPGENRGCIGCHEQALTVQKNSDGQGLALSRTVSEIASGPKHTAPFSYPLFVQPILDRNCVSCHSGEETGAIPPLTGKIDGAFTESYNQLKPYVRWYEWIAHATYRNIVTFPGEGGADISPMTKILSDKNHEKVVLSDEDMRAFYLWLDFNVPFYGVYDSVEQDKQLHGESVLVPTLQ